MSATRTYLLTALTMVAFAANSILCRLALNTAHIDPATFMILRLSSSALVLWLLVWTRSSRSSGDWPSGLLLIGYAITFSLAYVSLAASTGALLLFGAVQATMIVAGFIRGERLNVWQVCGFVLAVAGLVYLLLPGLTAPPLPSAVLMLAAGIGWGGYSLRGRNSADPIGANAGNFARALPFAVAIILLDLLAHHVQCDLRGFALAITSGAVTTALGYVIWFAAMRGLNATRAATVQLSVPLIAAIAGVLLLNEKITLRLTIASVAILGGIALVVLERRVTPAAASGNDAPLP